jgi:SIR2-like domain
MLTKSNDPWRARAIGSVGIVPDHVLSKQNPQFVSVVDSLAEAGSLVVVVGAGVSIEARLPDWRTLVKRMVRAGMDEELERMHGEDHPKADPLVDRVMSDGDLRRAATMTRMLLGDRRDAVLREALYKYFPTAPAPGRTANAIAALVSSIPNVRIATTNYDELVEEAIDGLSQSQGSRPARSLIATEESERETYDSQSTIPVLHLHGRVPFGSAGIDGHVILDERDFATARVRPPGKVLPDVLVADVVLFVGMSMTDPNVVDSLEIIARSSSANPRRKMFGLFVGGSHREEADLAIARLNEQRLRALGIRALDLASYAQVSQVIYESLVRKRVGQNYWRDSTPSRYGLRLTKWRHELETRWPIENDDEFRGVQDALHEQLCKCLDGLSDDILPRRNGEHLGLHLWVRRPGPGLGSLELWGASAQTHRRRWSLSARDVEISGEKGVPASDALYFGSAQLRNAARTERDRWQAMLAVPVELFEDPWRNLFVGTITLASTAPLSRSGLSTMNTEQVQRTLHTQASEILMPG